MNELVVFSWNCQRRAGRGAHASLFRLLDQHHVDICFLQERSFRSSAIVRNYLIYLSSDGDLAILIHRRLQHFVGRMDRANPQVLCLE